MKKKKKLLDETQWNFWDKLFLNWSYVFVCESFAWTSTMQTSNNHGNLDAKKQQN